MSVIARLYRHSDDIFITLYASNMPIMWAYIRAIIYCDIYHFDSAQYYVCVIQDYTHRNIKRLLTNTVWQVLLYWYNSTHCIGI